MAPVPLVQAIVFAAAEKRIWITNSYCTPTDDQVEQPVKAPNAESMCDFSGPGRITINR